jgi:hypothetical protein
MSNFMSNEQIAKRAIRRYREPYDSQITAYRREGHMRGQRDLHAEMLPKIRELLDATKKYNSAKPGSDESFEAAYRMEDLFCELLGLAGPGDENQKVFL